MPLLLRQIWTLTEKNLRITVVRHPFSTPFRAFILPVVFIAFLAYARNLFIPPANYGIGQPAALRTLSQAVNEASGGRNRVVFVNNGFNDGDIQTLISRVTNPLQAAGQRYEILTEEEDLLVECQNSIRGASTCIAAAVFYSSPTEGSGGIWNYSIRADAALGRSVDVDSNNNDPQIYTLPLQHAIDYQIALLNTTGNDLPETVQNYPYTSLTVEQRNERIRIRYMGGIIDILAVAFFIAIVGVSYQLTGLIATEREIGMAQLLDCMMPNKARWQPQMVRILANHLALDLVYGPGWIVIAVILGVGVFTQTSMGIHIIFNILAGLSMSSLSILGSGFFRKAQLSGITLVIASLLLAIISQVVGKAASTGAVAVLSLLFPPMTYVYFTIFLARWERQNLPANLVEAAPDNPWTLPGIVLWIFLIIQIIVYPILGAIVERTLYGTASSRRKIQSSPSSSAVVLSGFTKLYQPNWLQKFTSVFTRSPTAPVLAVNDLNLQAVKGEIMVLLGANGSGKSTTLDAIAGLSSITSGSVDLNFPSDRASLGLCPQKNVLWDHLTVEEHVRVFNKLKSIGTTSTKDEIETLLRSCDVIKKAKALSKTLSGGQKRKLQLAMMFTGGSSVCCVDEVSSGLDPLSRRKIWDILLAERGKRSIILTTHFLDEADLLADHIAMLSRGVLKAFGTSVELKHKLGSGYRVHAYKIPGGVNPPRYDQIQHSVSDDQTVYLLPTSTDASRFLTKLEEDGVKEYQVSGPTIEDVFLKLADEVNANRVNEQSSSLPMGDQSAMQKEVGQTVSTIEPEDAKTSEVPELLSGRQISFIEQAKALFSKRWVVIRRNSLPSVAAFIIPVIAAGLTTLFLKDFALPGCSPDSAISISDITSLSSQIDYQLLAGPAANISIEALVQYAGTLTAGGFGGGNITGNTTQLQNALHTVNNFADFRDYIDTRFANVTPGGVWLGSSSDLPTFAWRGNAGVPLALIIQNLFDNLLTGIPIATQYQPFDIPFAPDTGKPLQLITYLGLAMSVYPAFFALYPTIERLRNVRGLHYSNGVRPLPLWLAYVTFDFMIVLAISVLIVIIFRGASDIWYHIGYLFPIFFLYGLASTLQSYVVSLFSKSQLAAFAFAAAGQAIFFLLYFIAFLSILTYVDPAKQGSALNIAHFTMSAFSPICNLTRAMFVALNVFSVTCRNREFQTYPGAITAYGGPLLYLIMQTFFLFGLLLWWDSGTLARWFSRKKEYQLEEKDTTEEEVSSELTRVNSSRDGLRVLNLSKQFKKNLAVNNVTFGVPRSEVFALLGPNGAGKSTCISLIRGDIQPSYRGGDIFVEDVSVIKNRSQARSKLGVCPQFDAMDTMTVQEHLHFYANVRGISDPKHNVLAVMQAVGLEDYAHRMAAKLSGGNKRKLSLGIALMGNPSVLLLDEPSSGMDAASKRVMWRTLASVVPGRSLVLTTHSMEEADALASRAGIMAGKMLALGTTDYLRRKHGDSYYVHLVHKSAPHTTDVEMEQIRSWVNEHFTDADIESNTYHGQLRFAIPMSNNATTIAALFTSLENQKSLLGIEYYSVSRATLDQVFLSIVNKHNVEEEGEANEGKKNKGLSFPGWLFIH